MRAGQSGLGLLLDLSKPAALSVSKANRGGAVPSSNLAMPRAGGASLRSAHFARVSAQVLAHLEASTCAPTICAAHNSINPSRSTRLKSRVFAPAAAAGGAPLCGDTGAAAGASALPVGNHGENLR